MRIKVQHDNRETGPFTVAELFRALEAGEVCAMDWCWDDSDFRGIRTVHQVLTETSKAHRNESRSAAVRKLLQREASAERVRSAMRDDPELKAELEDYKRRLDRELLQQKEILDEERKGFLEIRSQFFEERSRLEADLSRAREDIEHVRETIADAKKRLAERHRRHAKTVGDYEARRKRANAELAREQERISAEWNRMVELEKRLNGERADLDEAKQQAAEEAEAGRARVAEELKRVRETARKLSEDKAEVEEHRRRAVAHLQEVKDRLDDERRRLEEKERSIASSRADFDAHCRKANAELNAERKRLEDERRQLMELHREFSASASTASQVGYSGPKDDKYYGRLLGLTGKVSYDEIKRAYRFNAFRCHPDKVQDLHPDFVSLANGKLRELNEAFEYFRARYEKKKSRED